MKKVRVKTACGAVVAVVSVSVESVLRLMLGDMIAGEIKKTWRIGQ